ncbi:hypothetical protein HK097_000035 [Rhizophlyctis rosea]|uniref:RING-type domain-containing protein n=1 Tax=Rhizophlyctis rosea TaxID=64517 RepID=A0AAD5SMG7_9FUNG|nr:hypothetical protein HK097_000035 [Rhizophlyctis rosea]
MLQPVASPVPLLVQPQVANIPILVPSAGSAEPTTTLSPPGASRPTSTGTDGKFAASVRSLLQKINPPSAASSRNATAGSHTQTHQPIVMPPRTLSRHPSAIPGRYPLAAVATLPRSGPAPTPLVIPSPARPQIVINPRNSSLAASRRATYHRRRFTYLPEETEEVPLSPTSDGLLSSEGEVVGSPATDSNDLDGVSMQGTIDVHDKAHIHRTTEDDSDANWNDTLSPVTSPTSTHPEELSTFPRNPISLTTCPLCSDVCEKAVRLSCCNAISCSACIWRWLVHSRSCPFCRTRIGPMNVTPAPEVQKIADGLIVRCKAGCGWRGPRREVLEHLSTCEGWRLAKAATVKERSSMDGGGLASGDVDGAVTNAGAAPGICKLHYNKGTDIK